MKRLLTALAVVLCLPLLAGQALAQTAGYTTASVNLRAGPGTNYPTVTVIPAESTISVYGCEKGFSWCDVSYGHARGWLSSQYIYVESSGNRTVLTPALGASLGIAIVVFDQAYWNRYYSAYPWFPYWNRYYHPYGPYPPVHPYHPLPGPYCYHAPQAPECHYGPHHPYGPYHPYHPYGPYHPYHPYGPYHPYHPNHPYHPYHPNHPVYFNHPAFTGGGFHAGGFHAGGVHMGGGGFHGRR